MAASLFSTTSGGFVMETPDNATTITAGTTTTGTGGVHGGDNSAGDTTTTLVTSTASSAVTSKDGTSSSGLAMGVGLAPRKLRNVSAWPYTLAFLPYPVLPLSWWMGGGWTFAALGIVFVLIPIIDVLMGTDDYNPTKEEEKILEKRISFRAVTWAWVPMHITLVLWACYQVAIYPQMSWMEYIGFLGAVGLVGGLGINCAHELIHKAPVFEQMLGRTILAFVGYGHFYVEHLFGHHKRVSTPDDPASSRYGEIFYTFWWRSVVGSFLSAVHLERARLNKCGLPELSPHNRVVQSVASTGLIAFGIFHVLGAQATIFFAWQCFLAFSLLEIINYVEHYGLERKPKPAKPAEGERGDFERITPAHSWNAGHRCTNYFLFKLQRHSDHHAYAGRRYQILRTWQSSPQLPFGYATMLLIALVPPLWFRIMNWRVLAVRQQYAEWERANINPFVDPSKSQ
ncbi:alkane-1 monooxygenase [Capsaspora owczarzaki ATCC 30864]|uniref:Alkane-1 monooxygenase n=1 Tax=Capsaspora owczarzaki (strain ATCC 30864) TaxID=595528 RepID=A0A0D2U243_CAPO3|nr:alkane-1 monooxygenase [Capsaspora owczarzaki ATCC 30864]KJE89296.1 alkane-1 monooxygenase [Capsaspora owczarzaki ATCC 30864]|eukprot:XP_004365667.1 alkane-1 monooxygenase [Capsaspora owczarzaki ATCC 30864]